MANVEFNVSDLNVLTWEKFAADHPEAVKVDPAVETTVRSFVITCDLPNGKLGYVSAMITPNDMEAVQGFTQEGLAGWLYSKVHNSLCKLCKIQSMNSEDKAA